MNEELTISSEIKGLLEKGRLSLEQKTPSQARTCFFAAWELATRSGDALAVEAAMLMSLVEPQKLQQEWIVRAIRLAEESTQSAAKHWLGSLYTSLGWKRFDMRQYDTALTAFQSALEHYQREGGGREVFVSKWSIGKLLRVMGRPDEALVVQNALLAELGVAGPKDGRLFEELAECLYTLKRSPEAQPYFELAYRELCQDEWVVDNQPAVLKRLKELGKAK
jgi:tetratricopeptide (TPR) repeat protein